MQVRSFWERRCIVGKRRVRTLASRSQAAGGRSSGRAPSSRPVDRISSGVSSPRRPLLSRLRRMVKAWATSRSADRQSPGIGQGRRVGLEPQEHRVHLGRRPEAAGLDREQARHRAAQRDGDGQPAIGLAAGGGRHPLAHFLLQHHVQVREQRRPGRAGERAAAWRCCRAGWRPAAAAHRRPPAAGSRSAAHWPQCTVQQRRIHERRQLPRQVPVDLDDVQPDARRPAVAA